MVIHNIFYLYVLYICIIYTIYLFVFYCIFLLISWLRMAMFLFSTFLYPSNLPSTIPSMHLWLAENILRISELCQRKSNIGIKRGEVRVIALSADCTVRCSRTGAEKKKFLSLVRSNHKYKLPNPPDRRSLGSHTFPLQNY